MGIIDRGDKLAKKVTKVEKTLETNQIAWTKLFQRLGLIALALWGGTSIVWNRIKDLPDKVNEGHIEKIEDTPGERSWRIKGGREAPDPAD